MSSYQIKKTLGDTEWFRHDRFGVFIHWGLYAMPARSEWVKSNEQMSETKYDKYFRYFNPDLYDPEEWAEKIRKAGAKYVVLTAKHHEGFCLFDSAYTDYKSTNTQAGCDLVRRYVDAFRAAGLKIGFYYSLIDWHHPDFTIDFYHPRRSEADVEELNRKRNMHRYAEYMKRQITELLTGYGKIDILWFDFSYDDRKDPSFKKLPGKGKADWEAQELVSLARSLQPWLVIDNRCGIDQDIWTPEQYQVNEWLRHPKTGELVTWEACQTLSGSWGYHREESTYKKPEMLIQMLISTVACGGNLLMNIGPTSRGNIDIRAQEALEVYESWMKYNGRSIYGCTMAEPELLSTCPNGCRYTQSLDGKRLYIHLFSYPYRQLEIPGLAGKVDYAQFLHDGSEILCEDDSNWDPAYIGSRSAQDQKLLIFKLPPVKPDVIVPVIEVFLKA